jgi:hypothetical protein
MSTPAAVVCLALVAAGFLALVALLGVALARLAADADEWVERQANSRLPEPPVDDWARELALKPVEGSRHA